MAVENDQQLNVSSSSWISLLNPGSSSIPLGLGILVTIAAFLLFNTGTAWNEETPLTCKTPLADSAATYFDFVSPFIRALTTHIDNFPDWQPDTWRFAIYDAKAAVKKITQKSEEEQDQIVEQIWKTISNGAHSINMNKLVEQANLNSIPGAAEKLEYYLGTNELNLEKTKLALKIGAKCVGEIEMRGSFSDILAEHKVCVQEAIDEREVRELEEQGFDLTESTLTHAYCFESCNLANAANSGASPITTSNTCGTGTGMTLGGQITLDPKLSSESARTFAIVMKHDPGNSTPREIMQSNSFILNSEAYPHLRAQVLGGTGNCIFTVSDVSSTTAFVHVVITIDGTNMIMYKNGNQVGSQPCTHLSAGNSNQFLLGSNGFAGVIKSFAVWDRALAASEVAALSSSLACIDADKTEEVAEKASASTLIAGASMIAFAALF